MSESEMKVPPFVANDLFRTTRWVKKILLSAFCLGVLIGIAIVSFQVAGALSVSRKEFMTDYVLLSIGIVLAALAVTRITGGVYESVVNKVILNQFPITNAAVTAETKLEAFTKYVYLLTSMGASIASGAFIGGWLTLLFSGYLWVLIGAK